MPRISEAALALALAPDSPTATASCIRALSIAASGPRVPARASKPLWINSPVGGRSAFLPLGTTEVNALRCSSDRLIQDGNAKLRALPSATLLISYAAIASLRGHSFSSFGVI